MKKVNLNTTENISNLIKVVKDNIEITKELANNQEKIVDNQEKFSIAIKTIIKLNKQIILLVFLAFGFAYFRNEITGSLASYFQSGYTLFQALNNEERFWYLFYLPCAGIFGVLGWIIGKRKK